MLLPALLMTTLLSASPSGEPARPNEPVRTLDIQRYAGEWHEIAHLPMYFERKCVDTITAVYSVRADGKAEVHNACRERNGQMESSKGIARRVVDQPGALKVRFAPVWLAWLPWVWADYWVIAIDPDYRWALVGGPSRKYLWVLSRSSTMDRRLFDRIRDDARQRGYPVDRLVIAAPLH